MKGLLQNPYIVGALALVAVGIVFVNVVLPLTGGFGPSTTKPFMDIKPGEAIKKVFVQEEVEPLDYTVVGWTEMPVRDPFKPTETVSIDPLVVLDAGAPVPAREILHLTGVVVQPDFRLAMINKKILKEGESIGEYRVVVIKPNMVLLSGPLGRESISFNGATTMKNAGGGKPDAHGNR